MKKSSRDKKIGFVILHYLAYDMTKQCVDTLLHNFNVKDIRIIIVDNASTNDSGIQLQKDYFNNSCVSVVINDENLGFAKGNNVGYEVLKREGEYDFIIIMNNDVIIEDRNFIDKIYKIYERTNFYILGPDIYSPNVNIHQNPVSVSATYNLFNIDKRIKYLEWVTKDFRKNYFIGNTLNRIKNKISHIMPDKGDDTPLYLSEKINPLLHGACYIFSNDYIQMRKYAFYPETFLYFEEDILYYEAVKYGYKIVYSPEIYVKHLEDVSTDLLYSNENDKIKNKMKEQLKSALVYKKLLLHDAAAERARENIKKKG